MWKVRLIYHWVLKRAVRGRELRGFGLVKGEAGACEVLHFQPGSYHNWWETLSTCSRNDMTGEELDITLECLEWVLVAILIHGPSGPFPCCVICLTLIVIASHSCETMTTLFFKAKCQAGCGEADVATRKSWSRGMDASI